jgi:deoxyribodipyrimidine photolyase-related protein
MTSWGKKLSVEVELLPDDRFLCSAQEFAEWADGRKQLRMEYFYREMRRKTGLLMEDDKPAGGKWNFDADNRKPAKADLFMPAPAKYAHDEITRDVIRLVESRFSDHFGSTDSFFYGVTRAEAEAALDHFIESALPRFGDFQDAMLEGEAFLYHSVLSVYLNLGSTRLRCARAWQMRITMATCR